MDTTGARSLANRIRAGVQPGTMIELISDASADSVLRPGDYGTVCELTNDGHVVVQWERGFTTEIDPAATTYRPLGVGSPDAP